MTTTPSSPAAIDAGCTCQRSHWTHNGTLHSSVHLADPACPIHAQKRPDAGQEIDDGH